MISIYTCFYPGNVNSSFPTYCYPARKVSNTLPGWYNGNNCRRSYRGKTKTTMGHYLLSLLESSITKSSLQRILTLLSVNYLSTNFFSKVDMLEMQQQGTHEPCIHMREKHHNAGTSINSRAKLTITQQH